MTAEADSDLVTLDEVANAGRTALYRLYDATGAVIYIGISDHPVGRMQEHAREQSWWPEVADKTAVWYQTRAAAETAETIEIGISQPKYNQRKRYVRLPEQPTLTAVADKPQADRHDSRAISIRPARELRAWLVGFHERTGRSLNAIVSAALTEYRARHDPGPETGPESEK